MEIFRLFRQCFPWITLLLLIVVSYLYIQEVTTNRTHIITQNINEIDKKSRADLVIETERETVEPTTTDVTSTSDTASSTTSTKTTEIYLSTSRSTSKYHSGIEVRPDYKIPTFPFEENMSDRNSNIEAENKFYQFVTYKHVTCPVVQRMGNINDGGWNICMSPPYQINSPCIIYSFGINNDFSFDDAFANKYQCDVYAFDPSMKSDDHIRGERVHFYRLGLGGSNRTNEKGWKLETFKTITHKLGHANKTIDVLKIDIEYSEWESFDAMFKENALSRVKQLVFEIHTPEVGNVKRSATVSDYIHMYKSMATLERLGFRKFDFHENPWGFYMSSRTYIKRSCCYELGYINMYYLYNHF